MKNILFAIYIACYCVSAYGQTNVGIGTNSPITKLDINGAISLREGSVLTLSGTSPHNNVSLPFVPSTTDVAGFCQITGPGAAFSVTGIIPSSGADGQIITLINPTGYQMTLVYASTLSSPANRIYTQTGANLIDNASLTVYSSVTLQYSKNVGTSGGWLVNATQNYTTPASSITGTIAAGNMATLSGDVTGAVNSNKVVQIQGNPVSNAAPSNQDVLQWNGTNWAPSVVVGPAGAQGAAGTNGINAYTTTSAGFTQPAVSGTVSVTVGTTAWMAAGQYIYVNGGGYYTISSITNGTTVVLTNLGYTGNAAAGATVASASAVSPGGIQGNTGSAGAAGTAGTNGTNAYTATSAGFTQPAISSTVSVTVGTTAWMVVGQYIYIKTGGYYTVSSITNGTTVVLTNLGYAGNAAAGATVASASAVSPGGIQGNTGSAGATGTAGTNGTNGTNAYTTTSTGFTQPAISSTVSLTVGTTAWMVVGQYIYVKTGGYYTVSSITNGTTVVLTNPGYAGNAAAGATVASASAVSPGGIQGNTGSAGATGTAGTNGTNGTNAYTTTSAGFTQPAVSSTVSVTVGTTAWMAAGQYIYINGGGYYTISSITNGTTVVLTNLGYTGNAAAGATVASASAVSPGGIQGATGASGGGLPTFFEAEAAGSNNNVTSTSLASFLTATNLITTVGTYMIFYTFDISNANGVACNWSTWQVDDGTTVFDNQSPGDASLITITGMYKYVAATQPKTINIKAATCQSGNNSTIAKMKIFAFRIL